MHHGIKPQAFCGWVFRALGEPGDDMPDLFPGSGAGARGTRSTRKEGWWYDR